MKEKASVLKRVNHVGVVVKDLHEALKAYTEGLGIELEQVAEIPDVGLNVGVLKVGEMEIELLQYEDPNLPVVKALRGDQLGINHLCYEVEQFDQTMEQLRGKGFRLIEGFPRKGVHGRIAFFVPPHSEEERIEILEVE